jgi:hypothetical protein
MKISEKYRVKALDCEQRSRDAEDYNIKCAWGDVAMEWHCLASRSAQEFTSDHELTFTTPRASMTASIANAADIVMRWPRSKST